MVLLEHQIVIGCARLNAASCFSLYCFSRLTSVASSLFVVLPKPRSVAYCIAVRAVRCRVLQAAAPLLTLAKQTSKQHRPRQT